MRALQALAHAATEASSLHGCLEASVKALRGSELDLPVLLCYALAADGRQAQLIAHAGLANGVAPSSLRFDLTIDSTWPLAEALATGLPVTVDDVQERLRGLQSNAYPEAIERACVLPIQAGAPRAIAILIAGISPRLPFDDSYRGFFDLIAAAFGGNVACTLVKESTDKLAEADKELEAFSYSVSHDLRAPLRAIDGFSKALLKEHADKLDDGGRRYLDRVRSASQRMAELIDDLLSLSRVARAPMKSERVDLTALARKVLRDLAGRDAERHVQAKVDDDLIVQGDTRLVTVVLEHLLGNAWKFTSKKPHGRIEFGYEQRDGQRVFFIRDNGAGFEMEYASKLFAPFQRLHSTTDFQGTGIGLAIVHRIIARHGGKVWADAAPGLGATFCFTLGGPA